MSTVVGSRVVLLPISMVGGSVSHDRPTEKINVHDVYVQVGNIHMIVVVETCSAVLSMQFVTKQLTHKNF